MADDSKKEKSAQNWGRDAVIFGAGVVTGVVGTVTAGHIWPSKVAVPKAVADAVAGTSATTAAK
ncbi:hypothetical protein LY474_40465 [Myxococcus stipitatus]|uniref:hypothetical protein n=1 Tax=Myxococcus stipitatus TaxID=83455 RepID=UPI001F2A2B14|nr:hypothetical protein [Myxococcus stipitatus]MCE9674082.1 hypothetical protein [Myxococcus stipitatus]